MFNFFSDNQVNNIEITYISKKKWKKEFKLYCNIYYKPSLFCLSNSNGAGNQCCYSSSGLLIYAADTFQGSTPDRSHDWGAAPYKVPGYVPTLSHWIDDVVTFYYCCLWNEYGACDNYMDQRPTRDCKDYNPPVPGSFVVVVVVVRTFGLP